MLFVGGYRHFEYRKRGGAKLVSSLLIDMLTLKLPKNMEVTVLSTPFKELTIPLVKPPTIKLKEGIILRYMPLLSMLPLIMSEIAKAHLVHVFAGGNPFSILIQIIAKILGRKVIVTFPSCSQLELYFEKRSYSLLRRKLADIFSYLLHST